MLMHMPDKVPHTCRCHYPFVMIIAVSSAGTGEGAASATLTGVGLNFKGPWDITGTGNLYNAHS